VNPRERRLVSDLRSVQELADHDLVAFRAEGVTPDRYQLMFTVPGIALEDRHVVVRNLHRCEIYLHLDYPRRPPVVTWQTPVFHPNLLGPDRNGGVCLGSWGASESLADLCTRLRDLVSYRSFNVNDPLDHEAADWVSKASLAPGLDVSSLAGMTVDEVEVAKAEVGL